MKAGLLRFRFAAVTWQRRCSARAGWAAEVSPKASIARLAGQIENVNMDNDDDLDELLDEVEKKFCRNVCVASSSHGDSREAGKCGKDNDGHVKNR